MKHNKGFAHLLLLLVVIFVAIVGIGYYAYQNGNVKTIYQNSSFSPSKYDSWIKKLYPSPTSFISPTLTKTPGSCTLAPRWRPTKPIHTTISSSYMRDRVTVQFTDGSGVRLRNGSLISLTGQDLSQVNNILNQFDVDVEILYTGRSEEEIEAERIALQTSNCKEFADMNLAYLLKLSEDQDPEKLIDLLNALPIVELADPVPIVYNP